MTNQRNKMKKNKCKSEEAQPNKMNKSKRRKNQQKDRTSEFYLLLRLTFGVEPVAIILGSPDMIFGTMCDNVISWYLFYILY